MQQSNRDPSGTITSDGAILKELSEHLRGREGLTWQQQVGRFQHRIGSHRSRSSIRQQANRPVPDVQNGRKSRSGKKRRVKRKLKSR
jgi:hypothetical protein